MNSGLKSLCIGVLATFMYCTSLNLFAHDRSESTAVWQLEGKQVSVAISIKHKNARNLLIKIDPSQQEAQNWQALAENTFEGLAFLPQKLNCKQSKVPEVVLNDVSNLLKIRGQWQCDAPPRGVLFTAFFDVEPYHLNISRLYSEGVMWETVFTRNSPQWYWQSTQANNIQKTISSFWQMGAMHILSGADHLAFLLGLLLLCRRIKDVIWLVTGFTLGHSLTLGLTALGWLSVDSASVEAMIGLTIAFVAAEFVADENNAWRAAAGLSAMAFSIFLVLDLFFKLFVVSIVGLLGFALFSSCYFLALRQQSGDLKRRLRMQVALLFGLIHGFGFGAGLLEAGLPVEQTLWALLGFNMGVESGQLLLILLFWFAVIALRTARFANVMRNADLAKSLTVGILSSMGWYWFVSRAVL